MKIVGGIFEKMKILFIYFFLLRELPLILRVDRKRKKNELEIIARWPEISNLNEIGHLV